MGTNRAAVALGRKGGKAGTGEAKRRGDSAHYRAIRAMRKTYAATVTTVDGTMKAVRVTIPED